MDSPTLHPIPPSAHDPLPKVWDENDRIGEMLKGRRGLIIGVANEHSIAHGCAAKLRGFGAEVALTYLNDKAKPHVQPLAERIEADVLLPLDVTAPGQVQAVFDALRERWGVLDFVIHSIAFARRTICTAGWWIVRARASCRPCRFPATPSSKSRTTRQA